MKHHTGGRPPCLIREAWAERFGLSRQARTDLTESIMAQLSHCKGDEQRRIILGIPERTPFVRARNYHGKLKHMPVKQIRKA